MIVRARHASVLRHIPRGARQIHREIVSTYIDATLRELPESAFSPYLRCGRPFRLMGQQLWEEIESEPSRGPSTPMAVPRFLELLSGDASPSDPDAPEFDVAFVGTPLVAVDWFPRGEGLIRGLTRGNPRHPKSREVVGDGRDRFAAAAAYLGDEVAIVGDKVMVRRHPMAVLRSVRGKISLDVVTSPHSNQAFDYPFDIGRMADPRACTVRLDRIDIGRTPKALLAALPDDPEPGNEAVFYASALPGAAVASVALARATGLATFSGETLDLCGRLQPYADAGAIGALNLDEVETALALCREMARRLRPLGGSLGSVDWAIIDTCFFLQRIGGLPRRKEDEAALCGLAP